MTTSPPSSDCFSRMAGICNGFTPLSSVYQKNQKSGGINSFANWEPNASHHSANERGFHRLVPSVFTSRRGGDDVCSVIHDTGVNRAAPNRRQEERRNEARRTCARGRG